MGNCHARQYSDQMVCNKCGLVWDMNDPEPPECSPQGRDQQSTESSNTNQQQPTKEQAK